MGLIKNTVHYCCVSRNNQILYAYNGGDQSNETLAALCLEKSPPFHSWYFETFGKKTFGFLMDDGFVYFAIVDEVLGKSSVLKFLQHLRDEFKKAARKKNSRGSFTAMIGSVNVDDQLVPVVSRLIASLERVAETNNLNNNVAETSNEATNSTKAPLLGRSSKQEKKKGKDHVISLRDIELEEHRKSNDRGSKSAECSHASSAGETSSSLDKKEYVPNRGRSGSQSFEWKWRRLVQIVLAVDAAICLTLFGIWLGICRGIECTRS